MRGLLQLILTMHNVVCHFSGRDALREIIAMGLVQDAEGLWGRGYLEQAMPLMKQSVVLRLDSRTVCLSLSQLGGLCVQMLMLDEAEEVALAMLHAAHRYDTQAQTSIANRLLVRAQEERARGLLYGSAVQLHGLNEPHLNGQVGEIRGTIGSESPPSRYRVLVGSSLVSVQRENFSLASVIIQISIEANSSNSYTLTGKSLGGKQKGQFDIEPEELTATIVFRMLAEATGKPPCALRPVLPCGGCLEIGPAGDAALRRCAHAAVQSARDAVQLDEALKDDLDHLPAPEKSTKPPRGAAVPRASNQQVRLGCITEVDDRKSNRQYLMFDEDGDPIYLTAKELDELCLRHGQPFVSAKMEHSETARASAQCPVCPRGEQSQWATCKEHGTSLGKRCRTYPSTPSDQRLLEGFRPDAAKGSDARHRVSRKSTAQAARQTQGA